VRTDRTVHFPERGPAPHFMNKIDVLLLDTQKDRVLAADDSSRLYRVWNVSTPGNPRLVSEIPCDMQCNWLHAAYLVGNSDAILMSNWRGLVLLQTEPVVEGAQALLRVHAELAHEFAKSRQAISLGISEFAPWATTMLEDAGIEALADGPMEGISAQERLKILSDYGYWRSWTVAPQRGVNALKAVAEASPDDLHAWLRLGNAAQLGVAHVATYEDKRSLSLLAMHAYDRYESLTRAHPGTGRSPDEPALDPKSEKAFVNFNPATAPASDVCGYARSLFARGRDDDQFLARALDDDEAHKIDLTNDGRHLGLTLSGGSGFDLDLPKDVNAFEPDGDAVELSDVDVLPFRDGKFYILYRVKNRPYEVALANVGTVCRFHP
jgi:hypothetical protein